jgi:hypothetical protein
MFMKHEQAINENQIIHEYKSSIGYLQQSKASVGGMKQINEIIILLFGLALFGVGACGGCLNGIH